MPVAWYRGNGISVLVGRIAWRLNERVKGELSLYMYASSDPSTSAELYRRWERQQWNAQAVDFAPDRRDWLELTDQERWQWYWLAGFSHFRKSETHAVVCLARLLPYLPQPEHQHFLATQIADEARHAVVFERFHGEVLAAALPTQTQGALTISPAYQCLFIDSLTEAVGNAVNRPGSDTLAAAALQLFIMLEGSIALASFVVIRQLLTKTSRFPGLLEAMTHAHRDEVRHAQFGIALLRDIFAAEPSARHAAIAHMRELLPAFSEVLRPRPARKAILESLGLNPYERRHRAFGLLQRNLQALGLDDGLVEPFIAAA